ncbi:hypothetical protein HYV22_00140, partial [Candidatus Gottesmanbacteria bacterium]|nr:hypothetical protein [Candidatus Gottesmanbacteria bacterium]
QQLIEGDKERHGSLLIIEILALEDGRDVASALFTAMKVLDWEEQFARLSPENRKAADLEDYLDEDLAKQANRHEEEVVTARVLFPDLDKTAQDMQGRRERYVAFHMQKFLTRHKESIPVDILLFTEGVGPPPGHRLN